MNWISNAVPKIRNLLQRREVKENLWVKCPETGQLVFHKDVEANQWVIPGSNYHMRMGANARLKSMFDGETWLDVVRMHSGTTSPLGTALVLIALARGAALAWRDQRGRWLGLAAIAALQTLAGDF